MMQRFLLLACFFLFGFLGIVVLFGIVLHYLEKKNMTLILRTFGTGGVVVTGLGTVVHELGHLVMCLIFGHRVVRVQLFRPIKFKTDGVLGQVDHAYNPKNFYQTMGCFFIGIGPILFGLGIIALLLFLLLPNVMFTLISSLSGMGELQALDGFVVFFNALIGFFVSLFSPSNLASWQFWVFIVLTATIVLHMSLSSADLKGSSKGASSLVALIIVVSLILAIFNVNLGLGILLGYNIFMLCFMSIGVALSGVVFLLVQIPYRLKEAHRRNRYKRRAR